MLDELYPERMAKVKHSAPVWTPSQDARGSLLAGLVALALYAGLVCTAHALDFNDGDRPGVTPPRVLGWIAALPAYWVFGALRQVGKEVGSNGLIKSSDGLFGVMVVGQLLTAARIDGLHPLVVVLLWMVAIGFLYWLLAIPFSDDETKPTATEPPAETPAPVEPAEASEDRPAAEPSTAGSWAGGCFGALVAVAVVVLKFAGKVILFQALGRFFGGFFGLIPMVVVFGTIALFVIYRICFAVSLARWSGPLGVIATVVGLTFLVADFGAMGHGYWGVANLGNLKQAGATAQELEEATKRQFAEHALVLLGGSLLKSTMLAVAFLSWRSRTSGTATMRLDEPPPRPTDDLLDS